MYNDSLDGRASCSQQQPDGIPRPDAAAAIGLIHAHFLNRTDVVAFFPPENWKIDASPTEAGDNLDALLRAHLLGPDAPFVRTRWTSKKGKASTALGRFRIGTYSPAPDGTTVYGCVDCDGGGRHGNPLAMPLEVAWKVWLRLLLLGIEAHLEKSGGGKGWHVWLFFDKPVSAADVRRLLFSVVPADARLADGGLADAKAGKGIEVFPKQDSLPEDGGVGNMVWLPWWHAAPEGANVFYRYSQLGELEPYAPSELAVVTADALARALALPRPETPAHNGDGRWYASDRELALEALPHLSTSRAGNYHEWLRTGMALHAVDSCQAMLGEWDAWSRNCPEKYKDGVCAAKWATFSGNALGLGSLVWWARQDTGWTPRPPNGQAGTGRSNGKAGAAPAGDDGPPPGGADNDNGQAGAPDAEDLPAVEVAGLRLVLTGASRSGGGKVTARVAVQRDGRRLDQVEYSAARSARAGAVQTIALHAGAASPAGDPDGINLALGQLLVAADRMADRQASARAAPAGNTVYDVVLRVVTNDFKPVCQTAEGVWGRERLISRKELLAYVPPHLLLAAAAAPDAPGDRTKLIRAAEAELKVVDQFWHRSLPPPLGANLGAQDAPVQALRQGLAGLLHKRHWERNFWGQNSRVSLLGLVPPLKEIPFHKWMAVIDGVALWVRLQGTQAGGLVPRLAMRFELGKQHDFLLPVVASHEEFVRLGLLGGWIDPDPPFPNRVNHGTLRIAVLAKAFSEEQLAMAEIRRYKSDVEEDAAAAERTGLKPEDLPS
jgi:hypothetical protein